MLSRRFAAVVTIVIVVAFVVVAVAPAFAAAPAAPASLPLHARLLGTTPADGSTVDTATEVTLAFNEKVDPTFVKVTVAGPDGSETDGEPVVDGREVTQALAGDLPAGEHVVTYRVVSTDGHPVSGKVTFTTTLAPTPSAQPTASATPTPSATAGATASAAPSPTTTRPATAPVADDGSSPWPLLLGGLAVVAVVVALVTALARRSRGGHEGTPDGPGVDDRPGAERGPDAGHDPFA